MLPLVIWAICVRLSTSTYERPSMSTTWASTVLPFTTNVLSLLFLWRKAVASHEDDQIHMSDTVAVSQQTAVSDKLDQIDKWGKTLTVITVVFGSVLAAIYIYAGWVNGSKLVE